MSEVDERAYVWVRLGLGDRAEGIEALCEELELDPAIDAKAVGRAIDAARAALAAEAAAWDGPTDCERLERAFDALNDAGVIALHLAGYTLSDGHDDVREVYAEDPAGITGFCFYQQQDAESALAGGDLYLAFGAIEPDAAEAEGLAVGRQVVAALAAEGFTVEWEGAIAKRILLSPFTWRLRPAAG